MKLHCISPRAGGFRALAFSVLALATCAHAAVTNVAWYRLGENDPGAVTGSVVTGTTTDLAGANHLQPFGGPLYTSAVSADAASRLDGSLAVQFNGTSQYLSNAVVSTATDNYGLEAWVNSSTDAFGVRRIALNGSDTNGWGLIQNGAFYSALLPGTPLGGLLGQSTVATGTWTHLALVRESSTNRFYVNGALNAFSTATPIAPDGAFAVGGRPFAPASQFFNGSIDEVRVFRFAAGQFSTNDLLVNARRIATLAATGGGPTSATLNGSGHPVGFPTSAWFEFGFTTNYDNVTPPQALSSGNGSINFSEALTGLLAGVSYHFRAVASNALGITFGADQSFPRLAQTAYLKASNTGQGDQLGTAVAISGETLVVGAPGEDSNATGVNGNGNNNSASESGAAYVFVRNGDLWSQQAFLKPSNTEFFDQFGISVAMSGDTVIIGAPFEDSDATGVNRDDSNNTGTNSGAAYVFVRNGTNWTQQAYLKASNTDQFDQFGSAVAVSGDTVVVGASFEKSNATGVNGNQNDNSATNSGAAYVFVRSGTNWSQQAYLKANNAGPGDFFGFSVAASGDTVVVGADGEMNSSGAAYVFVRSGATWTQQAYLKASNPGNIDLFGSSVAIAGDTVVVGAIFEDSNATGVNGTQANNTANSSGAAYVFARTGTTWTQQAYLKASNTDPNDFFGQSVAVSGDTVVVGARSEDSNATGVNGNGANNAFSASGAAYVFVRNETTWTFQDYVKASNTDFDDSFGNSVAVSGDTVVIGAPFEDSNATGINGDQSNNSAPVSGAAYTFGPPLPPAPEIAVEHSFNTNIVDGGSSPEFLTAVSNSTSRAFFVRNLGNGPLTGLTIMFDGPDAALFSVTGNPAASVAPGGSTRFDIRFAPTSTGVKTATLHLANNDADENPFDINLTGLSLSFTEDGDGDGLNDATEFVLGTMVFDFQLNQSNLVNRLFRNLGGATSNLNTAGFFSLSQIQALNVNTPLLTRDPNTGLLTLTIGVEKATQLTNFFPFPMTAPQTTINAEGKLEFQFTAPDNAAFFRLEAR